MEFADIVKKHFNKWEKDYKFLLEQKIERYQFILNKCESPMEQMFLIYLIRCYADPLVSSSWSVYPSPLCTEPDSELPYFVSTGGFKMRYSERFSIYIYPQYMLMFNNYQTSWRDKKYRVDFLITLEREETSKIEGLAPIKERLEIIEILQKAKRPIPITHCKLVVEVDGHDYHERTKEQAQHDKYRDRLMTNEGFTIYRFTGSEIYHNAASSANEVYSYLEQQVERIIQQLGP